MKKLQSVFPKDTYSCINSVPLFSMKLCELCKLRCVVNFFQKKMSWFLVVLFWIYFNNFVCSFCSLILFCSLKIGFWMLSGWRILCFPYSSDEWIYLWFFINVSAFLSFFLSFFFFFLLCGTLWWLFELLCQQILLRVGILLGVWVHLGCFFPFLFAVVL